MKDITQLNLSKVNYLSTQNHDFDNELKAWIISESIIQNNMSIDKTVATLTIDVNKEICIDINKEYKNIYSQEEIEDFIIDKLTK